MIKIVKNQFRDIPKEVWIYPIVKFGCSLSGGLIVPIIAIYYRSLGFSLLQIGLVSMVFEMSMGLFEIPTGYVADRYGRKTSILYSLTSFVLVGVIYLLARDIRLIILAVILRGIGYTFMSGAFEAWAFDTLKLINKESNSRKMFVITSKFKRIGIIIGSLLGSLIGVANAKYVWLLFIFINVITLLMVLMSMKENLILDENSNKCNCNISSKLKLLVNDKVVYGGVLIVMFFLVACIYEFSMSPISEYWSIYLTENLAMDGLYLGAIIVFSNLVVVLGLGPAQSIIDQINNTLISLVLLHALMIISIIAFAVTNSLSLGIVAYIMYTLLVGVSEPLTRDYLNKLINSKYRATLLSIYAMAGSIGEIISGGIVGIIAESLGIKAALMTSAFGIGLIVILLKFMKNVENRSSKDVSLSVQS